MISFLPPHSSEDIGPRSLEIETSLSFFSVNCTICLSPAQPHSLPLPGMRRRQQILEQLPRIPVLFPAKLEGIWVILHCFSGMLRQTYQCICFHDVPFYRDQPKESHSFKMIVHTLLFMAWGVRNHNTVTQGVMLTHLSLFFLIKETHTGIRGERTMCVHTETFLVLWTLACPHQQKFSLNWQDWKILCASFKMARQDNDSV